MVVALSVLWGQLVAVLAATWFLWIESRDSKLPEPQLISRCLHRGTWLRIVKITDRSVIALTPWGKPVLVLLNKIEEWR